MTKKPKERITVGLLREQLKVFNDDCEIFFGNDELLTFYRTKMRGDNLVQIEFNEVLSEKEEGFVEAQTLK